MHWFLLAAVMELLGCYAFWLWVREERASGWLLPLLALAIFGWALARAPAAFAGRAFAAYAGVYLVGAPLWLIGVDRMRRDRWDLLGAGLALTGALIIVYRPRGAPEGAP
jgi:small multidrug resistance family-3 protein